MGQYLNLKLKVCSGVEFIKLVWVISEWCTLPNTVIMPRGSIRGGEGGFVIRKTECVYPEDPIERTVYSDC